MMQSAWVVFSSLIVGCFFWSPIVGLPVEGESCASEQQIVRSLFDDYDRHLVPGGSGNVKISFFFQRTRSVCPKSHEAVVYFYWIFEWRDEKLDFTGLNPCKQNITLGRHFNRIWTPQFSSHNVLDYQEMNAPRGGTFTLLTANGTVITLYHVKVTIPCKAAGGKHKQGDLRCEFKFDSLKYNAEELKAKFADSPAFVLDSMDTNDYRFDLFETSTSNKVYPAGNWQDFTLSLMYVKKDADGDATGKKGGKNNDKPQNDGQAPDSESYEEEIGNEEQTVGEGVIPAPESQDGTATSTEPGEEMPIDVDEDHVGEHVIEPDVAHDVVQP